MERIRTAKELKSDLNAKVNEYLEKHLTREEEIRIHYEIRILHNLLKDAEYRESR